MRSGALADVAKNDAPSYVGPREGRKGAPLPAMSVAFHIPSYLQTFAGGQNPVELDAAPGTAGEALEALWALYPALRDRVVDEQGEVRQHINIFVGNECIRFASGLSTPVPDGSEITIVPAVSGG